jgi:hypothetical protein
MTFSTNQSAKYRGWLNRPICPCCEVGFTPVKSKQRHCSEACRKKMENARRVRPSTGRPVGRPERTPAIPVDAAPVDKLTPTQPKPKPTAPTGAAIMVKQFGAWYVRKAGRILFGPTLNKWHAEDALERAGGLA